MGSALSLCLLVYIMLSVFAIGPSVEIQCVTQASKHAPEKMGLFREIICYSNEQRITLQLPDGVSFKPESTVNVLHKKPFFGEQIYAFKSYVSDER